MKQSPSKVFITNKSNNLNEIAPALVAAGAMAGKAAGVANTVLGTPTGMMLAGPALGLVFSAPAAVSAVLNSAKGAISQCKLLKNNPTEYNKCMDKQYNSIIGTFRVQKEKNCKNAKDKASCEELYNSKIDEYLQKKNELLRYEQQ